MTVSFNPSRPMANSSPIIADPRIVAARADGARMITMPHRALPKHLAALRPQYDPEWLNRMEDNLAPVAALVRLTCAEPASPRGGRASSRS